jgi:glycosyltransferase involved in cell wall biosynthesis
MTSFAKVSIKGKMSFMTDRTKVVHIITGLATGGAETMLLKLLTGMDDTHFQNSVIALTDAGPIGDSIRELGIPLTVLGMSRSLPMPWDFFRLYRQVRKHKPHVVQTWLYHADFLGYFAARLAGVKSIAWNIRCSYMGQDYYRGISGLMIKILAALSPRPEAVIVNSTAGRALHKSLGYHPPKWQIIPNGFDTDEFKASTEFRTTIRDELGISPNANVVGMVGRWDPVKGHDVFLKAASHFCKAQPDCQFVLVGAGCDDSNVELLENASPGLRLNLHLLGERNDIPAITAALDIAVCASIGEGFPNILGEAMACEVPCVATDVGDCSDIIADTGRIVPSGDDLAMAEAWAGLLALPVDEFTELGRKARQRVDHFYSIGNVIATYEKLYKKLAGAKDHDKSVTSR